jgi:hypothetical protein
MLRERACAGREGIMRILVCDGRAFDGRDQRHAVLDAMARAVRITAVIHGDAVGADRLPGEWARLRGVEEIAFPADWAVHGRAAGPIRNRQMLDESHPDLVVAFAGGRGTANMVMQARAADLPVHEVSLPGSSASSIGGLAALRAS